MYLYFLLVEYDSGYKFCMNSLRLFGGFSNSLDEERPFGSCKFPDVQFDNSQVMHDNDNVWKPWKDSPFECNLDEKGVTKIQTIHTKVCNIKEYKIVKHLKAVFQVGNGYKVRRCEQDLNGAYFEGDYKKISVTQCTDINVGSEELQLWILNNAEWEAVCLQHVYVVINSNGNYY